MGSAASRGSDATASAASDFSQSPALSLSPRSPAPLQLPAKKLTRQFTAPAAVIHHPPLRRGDSNHLVSLTSTTYGSLLLIDQGNCRPDKAVDEKEEPPTLTLPPLSPHPTATGDEKAEFHTPTTVINAWELMDGLDEPTSPPSKSPSVGTSHPHVNRHQDPDPPRYRRRHSPLQQSPKPLWKHLSVESLLDDMDPSVSSSLHRSLTMPAPSTMLHSSIPSTTPPRPSSKLSTSQLPADKVVIFTTTLRGVRRTYEDCCSVRSVLRAHRVAVDERDVSMDAAYRAELQGLLGRKAPSLPQVFVGGKWVGGAEEVRQLNETGELRKLLDKAALAVAEPWAVCAGCGGARFAPCGECSGSRKVFDEGLGVARRCPLCNENGLVRCSVCC